MYVGRFHPKSRLGRISSTFVAQNRLPVVEEVVSVYLRKRALELRRKTEAEDQLDNLIRDSGDMEKQVVKLIEGHIDRFGGSPTWGVIGESLGLSKASTLVLMRRLRDRGLISYTNQRNSLELLVGVSDRAKSR